MTWDIRVHWVQAFWPLVLLRGVLSTGKTTFILIGIPICVYLVACCLGLTVITTIYSTTRDWMSIGEARDEIRCGVGCCRAVTMSPSCLNRQTNWPPWTVRGCKAVVAA